jgi:type II secretory pathway predicted ATPase ExeA
MKINNSGNDFSEDDVLRHAVYERVAAMDKVVIVHDMLKQAITGLKGCIAWSANSSEPLGAILVGTGGTGKTTICKAILTKYPPTEIIEEHARIKTIPAFYASVPSPSTIKSLALNLLESLGETSMKQSNAITLTKRLCTLLKTCRTKIILLDEFHHLLAEGNAGDKRSIRVCNWLKTLINETKVMVCLVGVPECESLILGDTQMTRRFTRRFRLGELHCGTQARPGPLRPFLSGISKKFVENLELDGFVDFKNHLQVVQMWASTSGNPAFVMQLLKEATAIALLANRKTVLLSDFAEAHSRGLTSSVKKIKDNPFEMSSSELRNALTSISHRDGGKSCC